MPELPEVETTKQGLHPHLENQKITGVVIRNHNLREPVPSNLNILCSGKKIIAMTRRGKYLLLQLEKGTLLIHLGMSGHLRLVSANTPIKKHDHIDLCISSQKILRYHDPRRFGLWVYSEENIEDHRLLKSLGPEPFSHEFNNEFLFKKSRNKRQSIKAFIMDSHVVVGVGNIYATESLFLSKIHPCTAAGDIPATGYANLTEKIKLTLAQAIQSGGTTLRDFLASDGKPGYFSNQLQVYGRANLPCRICRTQIENIIITGRSSAFCPQCQPRII